MFNIWIVAANEFRAGVRNRWVVATILALGALALTLAAFGSTPIGETRADSLSVISVSLAGLSIYLIPLLALVLSFDAVVGERERGTLLLLMAYPLARGQLLLGKFTGQLLILALAIGIGYGVIGVYLAFGEGVARGSGLAFTAMMGSSMLLGAVFLALGCLISVVAKERSAAAGLAILTWLLVVVLYDLGLLALLLNAPGDWLQGEVLAALIAANPADAYRLFNLAGFGAASEITGMAALGGKIAWPPAALISVLIAWMFTLLTISVALFKRQEI